jgi:large conductance mechanosensitive channel
MLKEFREFAVKGNVIDMAVGIIIGGAFTPIVQSVVNDLIMPPIGLLMGGINFGNYYLLLKEGAEVAGPYTTLAAAKEAGAVTLNYGMFFNSVLTFVIVAFAAFLLVKMINRWKREEAVAPADPTTRLCPSCATEIPLAAKRCPHCTSDVPAEALA